MSQGRCSPPHPAYRVVLHRLNGGRVAGLTLTEAQNINRSLLELGNVISALMQQAPHVPYRCPALRPCCCPFVRAFVPLP